MQMINFYLDICLFALFLSVQAFPGQLHFNDKTFEPELSNRSSDAFKETASEIEREVGYKFADIYNLPFNIGQQAYRHFFKVLLQNSLSLQLVEMFDKKFRWIGLMKSVLDA